MDSRKLKGRPMSKRRGRSIPPTVNGLFPGEKEDIKKEAATIVADPKGWFDMPNDQLGGQKPKDLIGTAQEQLVRDLLRSIKHGMPT